MKPPIYVEGTPAPEDFSDSEKTVYYLQDSDSLLRIRVDDISPEDVNYYIEKGYVTDPQIATSKPNAAWTFCQRYKMPDLPNLLNSLDSNAIRLDDLSLAFLANLQTFRYYPSPKGVLTLMQNTERSPDQQDFYSVLNRLNLDSSEFTSGDLDLWEGSIISERSGEPNPSINILLAFKYVRDLEGVVNTKEVQKLSQMGVRIELIHLGVQALFDSRTIELLLKHKLIRESDLDDFFKKLAQAAVSFSQVQSATSKRGGLQPSLINIIPTEAEEYKVHPSAIKYLLTIYKQYLGDANIARLEKAIGKKFPKAVVSGRRLSVALYFQQAINQLSGEHEIDTDVLHRFVDMVSSFGIPIRN